MEAGKAEDGYDCSFVRVLPDPSDVQSECPICLHVLREPYLVGCCGYRFCRACIEPIQKKRFNRCPLCKKGFSFLPDKQLERILNGKLVYCTHKSKGCEWQGKLVELDDHLTHNDTSSCLFEKSKCSYCTKLFYRGSIRDHEQGCTSKPVVCSYCENHEAPIHKMQSHHYGECPMYPVPCPNGCGEQPLRKDVVKHVDESCPLTILECPYQYSGFVCNVKMTRCDMPGHADMENHLCIAAKKIKELEEENASLKAQLLPKSNESTEDSPVKKLKEENANLEAQLLPKSTESASRPADSRPKVIKYLRVTNLPPEANLFMLQALFGQHGLVKTIKFKEAGAGGGRSAHVRYCHESSAHVAVTHSNTKGIRLKSARLCIVAVFNKE